MKISQKLRFGLKVRISLYERIAAFLEAGIDLTNALEKIQFRYKQKKDYRAKILESWIAEIRKGNDFSMAIKKWIPPSEFMLINAGMTTGDPVEGLRKTIVLAKSSAENKAAIKGGLIMPVILFSLILVMVLGFRIKMVPIFEAILPIDQWPPMAGSLYTFSSMLYDNFFISSIITGIIVFIIVSTMNIWHGRIRDVFDKLPPWSMYRSYQGSSFLISLSSLMSAGVAGYDAIETMNSNASPWMKRHLKQIMKKIKQGSTPGKSLSTGMLDKETAGDIEDYAELTSFEKAIDQIGTRALHESVEKTKAKMKIVSNLLLVAVAVSIVTIYASIFELQQTVAEKSSVDQSQYN